MSFLHPGETETPDSLELLLADVPEALKKVFQARYRPLRAHALAPLDSSALLALRGHALRFLESWRSEEVWSGYLLPDNLLEHGDILRAKMLSALRDLPQDPEEIRAFFLDHDEWLKVAFNKWLLANPGFLLELFTVDPASPKSLLQWLDVEFGLQPGDKVLHPHVISDRGRRRLQDVVTVTDMHLSASYMEQMLETAAELALGNQHCRGLLNEGSWVCNPANFVANDKGRFPVGFSYLGDEKYLGARVHIPKEEQEDYEGQKAFALRSSEHRRKLFEEGAYTVEVYATFLPALTLIKRFHPRYKECTS